MNWKINYWTILFALIAIGWQVSCNSSEAQSDATPEDTINLLQKSIIPNEIAKARIDSFRLYADLFTPYASISEDTSKTNVGEQIRQRQMINPNIRHFGIPRADLEAMATMPGADTVFAYLSIISDTTYRGTGRQMIDLIFYSGLVGSAPNTITPADGDGGTYYDFTNPCPTSCPPYN